MLAFLWLNSTLVRAAPDIDKGRQAFQEFGCSACHGATGRGGGVGPNLVTSPKSDEERLARIANGKAGTMMAGRAKYDPSGDLRGALKMPGRSRGHKAMPLDEVPHLLASLSTYDGEERTRLALRLAILTFVRTTELRAARWSEFEGLEGSEPLWRIPSERMKMKLEHIVPLATQAVAVLRALKALPGSSASPFLFPSPSREGYMSNNTMLYALYRMGYHGRATVHGFRAMASTALNEMGFRPDVIERQLAHQEQNAVRAAYNRAEYLGERRAMMKHWADYLDSLAGSNLIPMRFGNAAAD